MILTTYVEKAFLRRTYRFEAMWTTHPYCEEVILAAWNNEMSGSPSFPLVHKLKLAKNALMVWNKETFRNLIQRKKIL